MKIVHVLDFLEENFLVGHSSSIEVSSKHYYSRADLEWAKVVLKSNHPKAALQKPQTDLQGTQKNSCSVCMLCAHTHLLSLGSFASSGMNSICLWLLSLHEPLCSLAPASLPLFAAFICRSHMCLDSLDGTWRNKQKPCPEITWQW